jgi:hypothetical protein
MHSHKYNYTAYVVKQHDPYNYVPFTSSSGNLRILVKMLGCALCDVIIYTNPFFLEN